MKNKELKKDFIWNTIGSLVHAFNSLFFLIIVTRINGIENAGIFSYGFVISGIFLTASAFCGRNYQITDADNEFDNNTYKSFRYFTTIIFLILFSIILLFFKYSIYKYLIIFSLIFIRSFESISDVYYGIFQKNKKLYLVGMSLFFRNLIALIVFVLTDYLFKSLYISIISWGIVNILFLVFFDILKTKKITNEKFKFVFDYKKIINKSLYFFLYTLASAFILHVPRYFIDSFLNDEMQGVYGILVMPATMTALLTQFILQPYAVRLSEKNKTNIDEFKEEFKKILRYTIMISFGCIILAYLFGIPVLNLIYNLKLDNYRYHLLIIMIGSTFYALNNFLALIYTIKRDLKYQFILYVFSIIISLIFSYVLVIKFSLLGGSISYLLTMLTVCILYIVKLKRTINK